MLYKRLFMCLFSLLDCELLSGQGQVLLACVSPHLINVSWMNKWMIFSRPVVDTLATVCQCGGEVTELWWLGNPWLEGETTWALENLGWTEKWVRQNSWSISGWRYLEPRCTATVGLLSGWMPHTCNLCAVFLCLSNFVHPLLSFSCYKFL